MIITHYNNIVTEQLFCYEIRAINIIQYLSVSRVEMQKYLNCRPKFLSIRHLCVTLSVTLFLLLLFHYGGCTQVYLSIYVNFEIIKNDFKNFLSRTLISSSYTQPKILSHGLLLFSLPTPLNTSNSKCFWLI